MSDVLSAGDLLARRYRLIDRIGAGGMSVIWRARDEVLDRVVAVKVLAPELAADPQLRRLVRDEARNTAHLVHPHVAAVHDYGEAYGQDGAPIAFVVFELLAGEPLTARLTAGPLPWSEAIEVCAEVADALAAAHRIGIVHRDVTPDNVMLTSVGAKVFDFGIATRIGAPDDDEDGATFGTPTYVAQERLDGVPAQPATDVYALGVMLFEMLTGQPPYRADTWDDLARVPRSAEPPVPAAVPGLPAEVAQLCRRCLAREPAARPTAHQVAEVLHGYVRPRAAPADRRPPWRVALAWTGAAAVLAAAAAIGWVLSPDATVPHHPPAAAPTSGPATPAGTPLTSPAPGRSAPPTPAAQPDAGVIIARIRTMIDKGQTSGQIRRDVAVDLRQLLENLRISLVHGGADAPARISGLRTKIADRLREGGLTRSVATALDRELTTLLAAVTT